MFLLTAAGLKLYGLGVDPVSRMGVFSGPALQFLIVAFEIFLGVWLISGKAPLGAWLAALVAFTVFAGVSLYQGVIGQASCGCFGKLSVNPWYTFGVDVAALVALGFARPDLKPLWQISRSSLGRSCLPVACALGGYLLLLGAVAAVAHHRFGSIDGAIAFLRGERLSLTPGLVDMGDGGPGETREASLELTNRTDHAIRLIGGTVDCSCTVLNDLPVTVPPGETRSITVSMKLPGTPGMFTRKARLAIDDEGFGSVGFRLTGRINKASE